MNRAKEKLTAYRELAKEIKILENRLITIEPKKGYLADISKADIDNKLKELIEREENERGYIAKLVEELPTAQQRQVLLARYIDGHAWSEVTFALFGHKPNYALKQDSFERRVYRIHGAALLNANKALKGKTRIIRKMNV